MLAAWSSRGGRFADALVTGAIGAFVLGSAVLSATNGRIVVIRWLLVVFGAFVPSPDRMLQQFGLGLAMAVLVDALVTRCFVVPAVMRLFGPKAWRLPRWLDRCCPGSRWNPRNCNRETTEITRSNELR